MKILHTFRCGDLPLCVGDALGQLRLGGEYLLELVVGDAHRQAKFLQMVLGEDAVMFPADEKPDRLVVDRRVQDMLRNRHVAAQLPEIGRFVLAGLDLHDEIAMQRHDVEKKIDVLCLAANFNRVLFPKKRDALAE